MKTEYPSSIREINQLPNEQKRLIYGALVPDWIFAEHQLTKSDFHASGHPAFRLLSPPNSRSLEVAIYRDPADHDPMLYVHVADAFNNQIMVLMLVVNDMDAPRFNTDVDENGNPTQFGTVGRNIPAELAAMEGGLAPGQVRQGLRSFRTLVPIFEQFIQKMGHNIFFIEPLAYHNAIIFERYGFNYLRGLKAMQEIHEGFLPGGEVHQKLTDDNPFRSHGACCTVRGRSWAIHDGILGYPFAGFQMYKRVGRHAGIETFPDAVW